jgi:hypothetical protein
MVHTQIFAPVHIPKKYYQQLPAPSADRLIKDASQFLEMIKTNPQLMTTWTADAGAFFRFKPHKKYTDPGPGRLLMFLVANRPNQKFELLAVNADMDLAFAEDNNGLRKIGLWFLSLLVDVAFTCYDEFVNITTEVKAGNIDIRALEEISDFVTNCTSQSKPNSITRPWHGNNQIAKRHVYTIHWLQMLILILTQLFWQYRTPSSPGPAGPRNEEEREAYSSKQETRRATYFTLRRNSRGRRRIPKKFKSTPISLVREAARIQQIFWEMSQSKQQPKGGQPPPASPSPQPEKNPAGEAGQTIMTQGARGRVSASANRITSTTTSFQLNLCQKIQKICLLIPLCVSLTLALST